MRADPVGSLVACGELNKASFGCVEHGEVLHCLDFGGEIYMRQQGGGLLLGTYEQGGKPWSPEETP